MESQNENKAYEIIKKGILEEKDLQAIRNELKRPVSSSCCSTSMLSPEASVVKRKSLENSGNFSVMSSVSFSFNVSKAACSLSPQLKAFYLPFYEGSFPQLSEALEVYLYPRSLL